MSHIKEDDKDNVSFSTCDLLYFHTQNKTLTFSTPKPETCDAHGHNLENNLQRMSRETRGRLLLKIQCCFRKTLDPTSKNHKSYSQH